MAFWKKTKKGQDNPVEKKPGLFRRLWRKIKEIDWKNPVNRWKLLFAALVVLVVGLGGMSGVVAFTNNPAFCNACHEMAPEYETFAASAHSEATCVDCHIAPGGPINMLLHKAESLKEVYYHIVGGPDPIVQTVAVLDDNCLVCHSENRLVSATGDLIVAHKKHVDEDIPCVVCHSGVAHSKVVERDINDSSTYDDWTTENATKLMSKEYMNPNMGTCIDCHNKVNSGKKPWKDYAYQLPENGALANHGKDDKHAVAEGAKKDSHKETQNIILQAVGKQKVDVKLSMECATCHQEINTPKNHDNAAWDQNHGPHALTELDQCINCHTDSKWIRFFENQNIKELISTGNEKEKYTANPVVVKDQSRQNRFCSTCHADRPVGHVDSDTWLTAHADKAQTNEQKGNCYVCHDNEKPSESKEKVKAPTDVYCQFCHRTGFKGEQL